MAIGGNRQRGGAQGERGRVDIAREFPALDHLDIDQGTESAAAYAAWRNRIRTTQPVSVTAIRTALDDAAVPSQEWSSEHLLEGTRFAAELDAAIALRD